MATLKFVFRPSSKSGRHQGSLSLRIVHYRKPKTVSICCYLFPEEWDEMSQTIIYPTDNPERIAHLTCVHDQIKDCTGRVNGIIQKLEKKGTYTADDVIGHYRRTTDENKLTGYAAMLSAELAGKRQHRTAKAYGTVCRGLVAFRNGGDIPLEQISATLIRNFEAYLKENGKQPNTVSYYMRNLRAIYNKAVDEGRIRKDEKPFAGVFTGVKDTKKRALSIPEVNRLREIDFDKLLRECQPGTKRHRQLKDLERAWRLFYFCLYAHGMCFVDMCYLEKQQIKDGILRYYRKKTGKQIEVPVNAGMQEIIESFAREVDGSDYLLPVLADGGDNLRLKYETALRMQNRRLKKLAGLAELGKSITTHVARHSWASILKNSMQPLSVISEGLGHSTENMTRKYLASFDYSVLVDAGKAVLTAVPLPSKSIDVST